MDTRHAPGLLSVQAAVTLFGMTALFAKLIGLPALEITPLRSIFAGPLRSVARCR